MIDRTFRILLLLVIAASGPSLASGETGDCQFPKLIVMRGVVPPEIHDPAAKWSPGAILAYDILLRSPGERVWSWQRLRDLGDRIDPALGLGLGSRIYGQGTRYVNRELEVQVTREFWDQLRAVLPESYGARVVPADTAPAFQDFVREVCICSIVLDEREPRANVYFQGTVNLLYALTRIRGFPEVQSAELVKVNDRLPSEYQRTEWFAAYAAGDDIYIAITSEKASAGSERVTYQLRNGIFQELSVREAAVVPAMPAFPADVWGH